MAVMNVEVSIDSMAEALLDDGYLIVEGLAPDLTARARAELQDGIDAAPNE